MAMAKQRFVNVEFSGLRKNTPEYFEKHFTNGLRIGDIKLLKSIVELRNSAQPPRCGQTRV